MGSRAAHGAMLTAFMALVSVGLTVDAAEKDTNRLTIRVSIVDSAGEAVEGVEISRSVWTDDKEFKRNEKFTTDADGVAFVTRPESMRIFRLWIRKQGTAELFANWREPEIEKIPQQLRIALVPATTVGGVIVDETGEPIPDATVEVRYEGGGVTSGLEPPFQYTSVLARGEGAVRTGPDGKWALSNVPPGDNVELLLKVGHDQFIQDQYYGELQAANGVTTRQLREHAARIKMDRGEVVHGRVVGSDGSVIPGALVTWSREDRISVGSTNKVKSDATGSYRLPPLAPGKLFVGVAAEGWKPQLIEKNLAPGAGESDFEMEPGNTLRMRVVDTDGEPISDVRILVEGWRGIETFIIYGQTEFFEDSAPAKTDDEGRSDWSSAPDDAVKLMFARSGYSFVQKELIAGEDVHTIVMKAAAVINGKVVDDSTGEKINDFNLISVSHYPQAPNDPIVQRSQIQRVRNGEFTHKEGGWHDGIELMLQIEAEGYRPKRIGPFNPETGTVDVDVRMERASPLRGRVVGIDGQPVAGATVTFTTKDTSLIAHDWSYSSNGLSTHTDEEGAFEFSATITPPVIIATHESGYAEVALDLDEQPGTLKLQPWSRVEGRLLRGGEPIVGTQIYLRPVRMLGGDNPHVQDSFSARSDSEGRFAFEKVPPVPSSLSPYVTVWRESQLTSSRSVPLDLKPGETHTVSLGVGAVIRGKVRPSGDLASRLDMNYCLNYLLKRAPGITPPEPIARAGFDWRDGWSSDMRSSQESRGFLATLPYHFVKFESDGSFEVHGVDAGEYQFAISIYEPPEGCLIDPVGLDVVDVRVDESDVRGGDLDIGVIEVDVSLGPQVGEPFPNFRYEKLDPEEIGAVADMKGRYVLIDFWATWCAPCVKLIPELRQVTRQFDDNELVVLSVSLDEELDRARQFIAEKEMDWPQALLGQRDNPIVRQQLGISSVPIYYILDPKGELVHRTFQLDDAIKFLDGKLKSTGEED